MNKFVMALFISVGFLVPVVSAENDFLEEMCKLQGLSNEIKGDDLQAFIKGCVNEAMNKERV